MKNHHHAVFHLVHALLRDEVAAERITQQVFARARRRSPCDPGLVEWLYLAAFRFVRMYHWRSVGLLARRRIETSASGANLGLDIRSLVRAIVRLSGRMEPRDCELLALRHVLGMPLANIAQLLRMHPYEVSNRLAWAEERIRHIRFHHAPETIRSVALEATG